MRCDLKSDRLSLRLIAAEDASDVFAYASDPEVARNTSWLAHTRLEESEEYVRSALSAHSEESGSLRHVWAIRLTGDSTVIGTIDFVQDSAACGHIDFALARLYWGRGIVTEAAREVLGWAFRRLPSLQEVRSGGLSRNIGTMRVLEKLGFTERARTSVPRPPKFPEPLEATHFSLSRETFLTRASS